MKFRGSALILQLSVFQTCVKGEMNCSISIASEKEQRNENNNGDVVSLTAESFNCEVANMPHFVMFYDSR